MPQGGGHFEPEEELRQAQAIYEAVEPGLGAVITWLGDSAADEIEARRRSSRGVHSGGLLDGMLVGLKDNIDTEGVRTTAGASFLGDRYPTRDATVVTRLKRAGAIVVAKLNLAELAFGATTQNLTYGSCRNPWDMSRIPGGSSGGSGAALAAHLCRIALGTDTGASTRVPASVNGVVGLRPTFGSISNTGVYPVSPSHDTVGPMARTVDDLARLTTVVSGYDASDPYSQAAEGPDVMSTLGAGIKDFRIGIADGMFRENLDPGIEERVGEALEVLESIGGRVEFVEVPGADEAFEHWTQIIQCEAGWLHRERIDSRPQDFSPDVLTRLRGSGEISSRELAGAYLWRTEYRRRLERMFDQLDIIVAPTVGSDVPFVEGFDSLRQTRELGRLTYPWAAYHGPTMSLPIGFHPTSILPVGLAVVGAPWHEADLFRLGFAYQDVTAWHERIPSLVTSVLGGDLAN